MEKIDRRLMGTLTAKWREILLLVAVLGLAAGWGFYRYVTRFVGDWRCTFLGDAARVHTDQIESLRLVLGRDGTLIYEIRTVRRDDRTEVFDEGKSTVSSKGYSSTFKSMKGRYRIIDDLLEATLEGRAYAGERFDPFAIDLYSVSDENGKAIVNVKAQVGFEKGNLVIRGEPGGAKITLSRGSKIFNNSFTPERRASAALPMDESRLMEERTRRREYKRAEDTIGETWARPDQAQNRPARVPAQPVAEPLGP